jgi:hypothetical protein
VPVEVCWRDVCIKAECQVVQGKPLPTLWNAVISNLSVCSTMLGLNLNRQQARIRILNGVSGVVKTLLLEEAFSFPVCH